MTTAGLPEELVAWSVDELGSPPAELLHTSEQMSSVLGLRLTDGRRVVVKSRPDDPPGRAAACVAAQAVAAARLPVPAPLTPVSVVAAADGTPLARHAEVWRPGGAMLREDGPGAAAQVATAFAGLMTVLASLDAQPPIECPPWVGWDHDGPGVFPPIAFLDDRDQRAVPTQLLDAADRARRVIVTSDLPHVVGHGDFEAQNLRWRDGALWCIHDFDSLGTAPEAAFVGAAAASFASQETPTLAPLASSAAFLDAYQRARGRVFSAHEVRVAWAAGLWPAVWNARGEALFGHPPVTTEPLLGQLHARVSLAGLAPHPGTAS